MGHERINPEDIADPVNDLYSQVVVSTGQKQVHVAGSVARDPDGNVVGGSVEEQTAVTLTNVEASLSAAGAEPQDVVRQTIYALDPQVFADEGYPLLVEFYGEDALPASALIGVDSLAHPDYDLELEVTAVVEE